MKYAIIGTGGLGAYYGGRLAFCGHDVHFLARSDYQVLKEKGIAVHSCKGDVILPSVNVYNSPSEMPQADVVLVCIKTTGNASLPGLLRPLLKADTVVILVQNGLGMEQQLQSQLPEARIAGATAFICSSRIAPGVISHTAYGELTIAPLDGVVDERLMEFKSDMEASDVPCHIVEDICTMRWKKLVWNIPYNGMSVIGNVKTDVMTFDEAYRPRIKAMMDEVIEAGNACGAHIDPSFADKMIESTENMAPYYPSMYLDYISGRPMEIATMYDSPVAEAAAHGYDMVLAAEMASGLRDAEAGKR